MVEDLSTAVYAETLLGEAGDAVLLAKFSDVCDMPTVEKLVASGGIQDLTSKCVSGRGGGGARVQGGGLKVLLCASASGGKGSGSMQPTGSGSVRPTHFSSSTPGPPFLHAGVPHLIPLAYIDRCMLTCRPPLHGPACVSCHVPSPAGMQAGCASWLRSSYTCLNVPLPPPPRMLACAPHLRLT